MPYIAEPRRSAINLGDVPKNAGELNYKITRLLLQYAITKGESYQTYNDIVGVLKACSDELYRRKIAPYEDTKIESNGDVY